MAVIRHPAHDHEKRRLAFTLKVLDEEVRALRELGWSGGALPHAAFQIRQQAWDKSDRLLAIRSNPYFGRIDVDGQNGHVESLYIGEEGLPGSSRGERLIVDWRAPISAAFYRPDGQTALRRRIEISESEIVRIYDDYVRRTANSGGSRDAHADPMLHDLLVSARGGQLGSIVRTIQAKQDEIIRTDDDLVVVQGAAGTGKTVVALHRLAYLLYQARVSTQRGEEDESMGHDVNPRRTGPRSAPELKVAVFGPNRSYLRHIRSVLPSLGENDVVQTTFEEWVLGSLIDEKPQSILANDDLEIVLDRTVSRHDRERLFRRARTKGATGMAQTLTQYVALELERRCGSLRREPLEIEADVAGRRYTYRVGLPALDAPQRLSEGMPLAQVRELVRQRMRQDIREQAQQSLMDRGIIGPRSSDGARRYDQLLGRFDTAFERKWPRYSVLDLYRCLLGERPDLRLSIASVEPHSPQAQSAALQLGLEDLAPLAFLRLLVDGPIPIRRPGTGDANWSRLDHIVIDEVQDLSPLALVVLRAHAERLTVLGDMNQAIYAHRGSRSWQEILECLGNTARQFYTLSPTYRSTQQIAELANHIVRAGGLDGGVCRSFPRSGTQPRLVQTTTPERMHDAIIAFVNEVCSDETATVAILTRTAVDARSLTDSIADGMPVPSTCISDRRETQESRVYFMPAYLAKGIEFDAVVVTHVDDTTYLKTVNDATLLYVAVTRALHRLLVVWSGAPSPLIADIV